MSLDPVPSQFIEKPHFYIGLDLGQLADHSAVSVIEFTMTHTGHRDAVTFLPMYQPKLAVRFLKRLPLNMPYNAIGAYVRNLVTLPQLDGESTLIVDATGPGLPFLDFFAVRPLPARLIRVLITAGGTPHESRGFHYVSRATLLQNLALLFQSGALKLHPEMAEAQSLLFELSAIGHDASSSSPHDDLAMATALAAWRAASTNRSYLRSNAL